MFEPVQQPDPRGLTAPAVGAGTVAGWVRTLASASDPFLAVQPDGELVDLLRGLEELKCAAEALQAGAAATLDRSVRAEEQRRGLPQSRQGRGVAAQVALARRESPARGRQHLGLATILRDELPHTMAAFRAGRTTEWRATIVARETGGLSRDDRATVDAELAADPARLESMGDRELAAAAQQLSYRLDPEAAARRRRRAESERRVSLRPAPDVMSQLSALLPVKDGVAVFATLTREADALIATGDGRGRGQIMADTLVDRVLGRVVKPVRESTVRWTPADPGADPRPADPGAPGAGGAGAGGAGASGAGAEGGDVGAFSEATGAETARGDGRPDVGGQRCDASTDRGRAVDDVGALLHVVVSDDVLLGGASGSAHLDGYGPIPADLARELAGEQAWVRRLYTRPPSGKLVAADSRARRFPPRLAQLIRLRDQRCRTPWCGAPIRTTDHITAFVDGGRTTADNGQGLCEHCNYAKEAPGFTARPRPGPRHTTQTTTPTGHRYTSTAPPTGDRTDPTTGDASDDRATVLVGMLR